MSHFYKNQGETHPTLLNTYSDFTLALTNHAHPYFTPDLISLNDEIRFGVKLGWEDSEGKGGIRIGKNLKITKKWSDFL